LSQRSNPRQYEVQGAAQVGTDVRVNGTVATRQGEYFRFEGTAAVATAQWLDQSVTLNGATLISGRKKYVPPQTEAMLHDVAGNRTQDGRWEMRWDNENRLVDVWTLPAAATAGVPNQRLRYTYDADGRLIERRRFEWVSGEWSLAETTRYLNDGLQCVAEFNGSNGLLRRQVWGLDLDGSRGGLGGIGGLLWIVSQANGTHYAAPDGSGNVVALFGTSGTETARYEYGPFGELLRMSGTAIAAENPWRFSSKRQDPTTDWVHYEFRVYDPSSGRWLSRDPIGEAGGENLYGFVGNDPVNQLDLFGYSIGDIVLSPFVSPALAWYEADLEMEYETRFKNKCGEASHQARAEAALCPTAGPMGAVRIGANVAAKSTEAYLDIGQAIAGGGIVSRGVPAPAHLPGMPSEGFLAKLWRKCTGRDEALAVLLREAGVGNSAARRALAERVARESTREGGSRFVLLGRYDPTGGPGSYEKIADKIGACFFQLKDGQYPILEQALGHVTGCPQKCVQENGIVSDVFQINANFIAQQIQEGKRILLAHKPENLKPWSGYWREIEMLKELGFKFRERYWRDKDGDWHVLWEAYRRSEFDL
jgi:RHS repeat-associated protein